jgi:hypothetical protein
VQHELLDVALIEAIRKEVDFAGHSMRVDYAAWTRELADQIQSDERTDPSRRAGGHHYDVAGGSPGPL